MRGCFFQRPRIPGSLGLIGLLGLGIFGRLAGGGSSLGALVVGLRDQRDPQLGIQGAHSDNEFMHAIDDPAAEEAQRRGAGLRMGFLVLLDERRQVLLTGAHRNFGQQRAGMLL